MSIARRGKLVSGQTVTERRLAEEKRNELEAEKKQRENEALEKKYKRDDDGFQTQDQLDKIEKQLIEERENNITISADLSKIKSYFLFSAISCTILKT